MKNKPITTIPEAIGAGLQVQTESMKELVARIQAEPIEVSESAKEAFARFGGFAPQPHNKLYRRVALALVVGRAATSSFEMTVGSATALARQARLITDAIKKVEVEVVPVAVS